MMRGEQLTITFIRGESIPIRWKCSLRMVICLAALIGCVGTLSSAEEPVELRMLTPSVGDALEFPASQVPIVGMTKEDFVPVPPSTVPSRSLGAKPPLRVGGQGDSEMYARDFGSRPVTYYYGEQEYERASLGGIVDETGYRLSSIRDGLRRLDGGFSAWTSSSGGEGFNVSLNAGLGERFGFPSYYWGDYGGGFTDPRFLSLRLGPLLIDDITLGAGLLYTDYTGNLPEGNVGPEGWASVVWLSARFTLAITEKLRLVIRPSLYWLPGEGEIGFGLPAPVLGLPAFGFEPQSYATLSYEKNFGTFSVAIFDTFGARFRNYSLFDSQLNFSVPTDLTPIDRVGRYGFGGLGPRTDFDSTERFDFSDDAFDQNRLYFENWAGARIIGQHGSGVQTLGYLDRRDYWEHDFDNHGTEVRGGLWAMQTREFVSPYLGYSFFTQDDFDSVDHTVMGGFKWQRGPRLSGYAQAGYLWTVGRPDDTETWLAEAGLYSQIGPYTQVGFQGGRRVTEPDFGSRYLEDYLEGRLVQALGAQTSLAAIAGYSLRDRLDLANGRESEVKYAGLLLSHRAVTTGTEVYLMAGAENIKNEYQSREYTLWTYRASLLQPLGDSVSLSLFYQYLDSEGLGEVDDYTEHLLYFGVAKRL